jgi:hypothetical protein
MFLLGILSFFQISFIPGFIFLNIFKFKGDSTLQTLIYSFGLSLAVNYLLVNILIVMRLYISVIIYLLITIEFIYLFYIIKQKGLNFYLKLYIQDYFDFCQTFLKSNSLFINVIFIGSMGIICLYIIFFISNLGTIIDKWDAIFSWNKWANIWADNRQPLQTMGYYPQLIPVNLSISYVMIQDKNIQFFSKAIMPLFPLTTLLLFLDLAFHKKNSLYLTAMILYGVIICYIYNPGHICEAYVDIATAFFSFITFYTIIKIYDRPFSIKYTILVLIFASVLTLTKGTGLFILFISILFILSRLYKYKKELSFKDFFKIGLLSLFILSIVFSWFFIKYNHINRGIDYSILHTVTQDIHGGRTYFQRLLYGIEKLSTFRGKTGLPVFYFIIFLLICSLFNKNSILISTVIILPYFIIWGFFISYDRRNLTLVFPFIAYSSAFGLEFLSKKIFHKDIFAIYQKELLNEKKFNKYCFTLLSGSILILTGISGIIFLNSHMISNLSFPDKVLTRLGWGFLITGCLLIFYLILVEIKLKIIYLLFFIISICLTLNFTLLTKNYLIEKQISLQRLSGESSLNNMLYEYYKNNKLKGKILSDYRYMEFLPELKNYYYPYQSSEINSNFLKNLENQNEIYYLLILYEGHSIIKITPDGYKFISKKIEEKKYFLIFKYNGNYNGLYKYMFIKIKE